MPQQEARDEAKFLANDPMGVDREPTPRTILFNGTSYRTTIDPTWLRQLGVKDRGEEAYHSLSLGTVPVIVTEPAIIIQPVRAMDDG